LPGMLSRSSVIPARGQKYLIFDVIASSAIGCCTRWVFCCHPLGFSTSHTDESGLAVNQRATLHQNIPRARPQRIAREVCRALARQSRTQIPAYIRWRAPKNFRINTVCSS
jgi:hypothetical protein